ncbi:MAG: hypothetical protein COA96_12370 [SAR86 cluster bacterium]|uniref:Sugar transporter n=1 Tax=SAR86 cluster bacterium TaxID=2030880 RepID=A0A2A5AWD7_9GAMM|nr:MAG: hypothetical protein COA96_12370 [SAR86 cluster bacterium]
MNLKNFCKRLSPLLYVVVLAASLPVVQVNAQDLNLTPEQMVQLQALSAADRQALLNSVSTQGTSQSQFVEPTNITPRPTRGDAPSAIERNAQLTPRTNRVEGRAAVRVSTEELKQFGYELFAGSPTTFAPATDIPVPTNYIMGPGDTVILQLYGQQNVTHELVITREGMLLFPQIGPIAVAGLNFSELREQINEIVSTQLIGQRAAVTLGALRSIRIFVLGEAFRPGSYTVSSLSTMTNALFVSGGITNVGSLRKVQLRRQGVTIAELDLYDLLLRGDTSADQRLLPDDVLFIPTVGSSVAISGDVIRPAIYELKDEETAEEVLALSGGLLPTAFPRASKIERINAQGLRTVIDVDLSSDSGRQSQIRNGDRIEINSVLDQLENVVLIEGHLQRPGGFQWREGIRVSDVIPSISALLPNPDLQYALVVRQQPQTRMSVVHKLALGDAISNPGSAADLELQANDRIVTFGSTVGRGENLRGLLGELNSQASFNNPAALISVAGNVRFPGEYPYLEGMSVGDIVNSAGGMLENSDEKYALLVRKRDNQGAITVEDAIVNALSINSAKSVNRGDALLVFAANASRVGLLGAVIEQLKSQSDSKERSRVVRASGQVRFPGEYPLYEDMTVEGLVRAAGGYTESALATEAELTRYFVQAGAGRQIDHLNVDLQSNGALGQNLRLAEFDNLVVRQLPNWTEAESITISGEVISPGTYSIAKGDSLSSVLQRAGGLTAYADPNASILLRATLRERERELLEQYQAELQSDIAAVALEEAGDDQAEVLAVGENLLSQVENVEPLGRLVIDLPGLLAGAMEEDVIIRNGDQLFLPRTRQEVSILGEVNFPTSHLFNSNLSVADYIDLSGGLTQRSDAGRTYIIKANGQVVSYSSSRWFFQREEVLAAGDTIVVPFDVEPTNYLVTWTSVSTILFNLATSVLAIESVGN